MKRLLIAAVVVALLAGGWFALRLEAASPLALQVEPEPARTFAPLAAAAPMPPASVAPEAALPSCPHQQIDLVIDGHAERGCVGTTRTSQTGSVRRYVLDAERPSLWSLTLDTAAGQVIAARLAGERRPGFRCTAARCQGFSLSRPDSHGARTLTIADALLQAEGSPEAGSGVRIRATLKTVPDSQSLALACQQPSLAIVENDGALTDFCPQGGSGFEVDDAENYRYVFRDLEDQRLTVVLDAAGAVLRVSYGDLVCEGSRCAGVATAGAVAPGTESEARIFEFSGARLSETGRPEHTAMLNGRLLIPADQ